MMIKYKATKKLIKILTATNVCLLALYGFLYYQVGAHERESAAIYAQIGADQKGKEAYRNLQASVKNTQNQQEELQQYFINEDETVNFLSEVENLSRNSGAQLKLTAVTKEKNADNGTESLKLSLDAVGSFREVFHLFMLIEHMPYKTSFSSVFLKEGAEENNELVSGGSVKAPISRSSLGTSTAIASEDSNGAVSINGNIWSVSMVFTLESFVSDENTKNEQG